MAQPDKLAAFDKKSTSTTPLTLISSKGYAQWLSKQEQRVQNWLAVVGFLAEAGQSALIPSEDGKLAGVVAGIETKPDLWSIAGLPTHLPVGSYEIASKHSKDELADFATGWALGTYRFDDYLSTKPRASATLVPPAGIDMKAVERCVEATFLVRNLINEPANVLGPAELVAITLRVARKYKASVNVISGEDLLAQNYPAIYEVGKGSERPPQLIDLTWGRKNAPKLTLVGKGVVFDTGGYDIKPSAGMLGMKKDMGGAAHALALAQMIMDRKLDVRLRLLIPAVENSISGHAFRPSDIIETRSGKTVEIGNTDAEGRVILADALYEAASEKPEWLIDFATLTGARNVALGTEVAVLFSNNDKLAKQLEEAASATHDPLWRLPLWQPYWRGMKSKIADMNNAGSGGNAGAITAALFLQQFVPDEQSWAHFDFNAANVSARPGRPEGGEAMALRACFAAIEKKFGK